MGNKCLCKARNCCTPGCAPRGSMTKVGRAVEDSNSELVVELEVFLWLGCGVDQSLASPTAEASESKSDVQWVSTTLKSVVIVLGIWSWRG